MITKDSPGVEISVTIEPGDTSEIEGSFASDEPELDAQTVADIRDRLSCGDEWAWCTVKVSVSYNGVVADDYLGGCCYSDEKAFRADGYFVDMVDTCVDAINAKLKNVLELYRTGWQAECAKQANATHLATTVLILDPVEAAELHIKGAFTAIDAGRAALRGHLATVRKPVNAELAKREPLKLSLAKMRHEHGALPQIERDMAVRKVASEVRASTNYGAKYEYTSCGDQLALAVTGEDGYTRVYDCRVLRSTTFLPDGTQLE